MVAPGIADPSVYSIVYVLAPQRSVYGFEHLRLTAS